MLLGVVCLNFVSTFILLWTFFGLYEYLKFTGTCSIISYTIVCYIQRRRSYPTPVLLPRKSHGRSSLLGCSPWGRKESDTTERLHFHFSLSCTGEENGSPLQCSCLENPRDLHHFIFPSTMHKYSNFSISSTTLLIFCFILLLLFLDRSHPNGHEMVN